MEGCRRDANVLIILDPTPPSAQPFCERSCVVHTDVRSPPPRLPFPSSPTDAQNALALFILS